MKLTVTSFVYEPPCLAVEPETDYEAAVLERYWATAKLTVGKGSFESANGKSYGIQFTEDKYGQKLAEGQREEKKA